MRAGSMGGSTPGVRVTWNMTVPPQCVTSVRVKFRLSEFGKVVSTYNATNTSQTKLIQTGLQCATNYYIKVVADSKMGRNRWGSLQIPVFVGGK